ncbi:glycosyl hydrolase family 95 catalytic domain-containing protein [Mariniphaga sediminis]|uniref:glycosyl hydrolase family 95 catalytic domain-containing protein n=1 Tax=Mariniphaga sediminis TaxID=1628158 RepID=UPI00356611CA
MNKIASSGATIVLYSIAILLSLLTSSFTGKKNKNKTLIDNTKFSSFEVDSNYLTKHDIVFLAPTLLEAEGFTMGNGDIGGMVWNHESGIELQINKVDLWSEPMPEENNLRIMRHCGRLKIDFGTPVFSWTHLKDYEGRLSLKNAEVSYKGSTGFASTNINTWLVQGKNVWVVECENTPSANIIDDDITATVTLERVGSRAFAGWYAGYFPKEEKVGLGNTKTLVQGNDIIIEETGAGVHFAVACRIVDSKGIARRISSHRGEIKDSDSKFNVLVSVVNSNESENPKQAAIELLDEAEIATVAKLRDQKNEWYKKFWSKSFVKIGDDYLENIYYLRRYLMAAGSQGKYPVAFNGGLWRWNRDVLNWVTPHHWNSQQIYWGLCAQNDCELMWPYLNTYFNMIPEGEKLAKLKGAKSDALVINEIHDFCGEQVSINRGDMKYNYTPASQIAGHFWDYYDYTSDKQFLEAKAYVFMKKAANFYLDKLEWDKDKKEYFLLGSVYESADISYVKNPISDRNCIEALFVNCIKAASILKTDKNLIQKWQYVLEHLWERKIEEFEDIGEAIVPADEYYTEKRYSPLGWMASGSIAFPAGIIGIDEKGTELGKAVENVVKCRESCNAHHPAPLIAARMGMGNEALSYLRNGVETHQMYPQGLMTNVTGYPDNIYNLKSVHDLLEGKYRIRSQAFFQNGMEPISTYASTISEMMMQSNEGKIRVFPAIPDKWNASPLAFKLLARGAFEVSAEKTTNGEVVQVGIKSLKGNTCKLQNPWPNQKVSVYSINKSVKKTKAKVAEDDVITFETTEGMDYVICIEQNKPVKNATIFSGKPNKAPKRLGKRILGKESGWNLGPDLL